MLLNVQDEASQRENEIIKKLLYFVCFQLSTAKPLHLMAKDETFDQEKFMECYYSKHTVSNWKKGTCHIYAEVRVHDSILPQTYLKSHIKFVHGNKNDIRIEVIVLESKKVVEHGKIFI